MDNKLPEVVGGRAASRVRLGVAQCGAMVATCANRCHGVCQSIMTNRLNPDEQGVAAIHNGAMQILEEMGIEFLNEEAQNFSGRPDALLTAPM